jgi:predicted ABC-type ATPase
MPEVFLLGGPNGAGKTTLAFRLLAQGLQLHEFVNADEIARGLNPLNPSSQTGLASRLAIRRVADLMADQQSFAFEGTLSGKWQAKILRQCADLGYQTRLLFLWLPSAEMAMARVAERVQQGGHDVPKDLIQRRYQAGLRNLQNLYLPCVEEADVLDGSQLGLNPTEQVIAQKRNGNLQIYHTEKWRRLCQTP